MNKKLKELRKSKADAILAMRGLLDTADTEKRDLSAEELTKYNEMEASLDALDKKIAIEEKQAARETEARSFDEKAPNEKERGSNIQIGEGENGEFRNIGEFFHSVAYNKEDHRLKELRLQQMKNGTSGGFAIPSQFRDTLLEVPAGSQVVRPRALVIPAGDPPDSEISMPALDQSSAQNRFGGVTIYHQGESDTLTESSATLKKVTLKPKKLTGYMTASSELLNNWGAASAVLPRLMRDAMSQAEDIDFLSGDGVNKALGLLNSPCAVNYNRGTASQIAYADVVGMYARLFTDGGGSPVWLANRTTIPQLANIRDTGNNNLWTQSAVTGIPNTLMGIPIVYTSRIPALGTKGDLMLVDLGYYVIKDGSGPMVALSEHFRFQNDEVAFRIVNMVDGQPWLNTPIVQENTTNTESPFVILDTP